VLWLLLSRNELLNKCYIDTNTVGDTTGANLVRMKLCHDMNLLLP
jgi:hypothetical protein